MSLKAAVCVEISLYKQNALFPKKNTNLLCVQVQKEMAAKMQTTELPREEWDTWDPMLISEGLFSAANIFR